MMQCSTVLLTLACVMVTEGAMATDFSNQSGCHNSNILLNCPSYSQSQEKVATVRWRFKVPASNKWKTLGIIKQGKLATSSRHFGDRMTLHPNGSLEITSLKVHDETHYQCRVRAPGRRDSHLINLSVACDGLFTVENINVCEGDDIFLDCKARHRTHPQNVKQVKWRQQIQTGLWKAVATSNGKVKANFTLHQNGSLLVPGQRNVNILVYRCIVTKKSQSSSSERHRVDVTLIKCGREKELSLSLSVKGTIKTTSPSIRGITVALETRIPSSMTKANTPKTSPNSSVKPTPASKGCGGTLTAPTGGFQSPNFPSAYPANSYCKWTISVPQDYAAIHIKLDQMNLEYEESCQNDYIAIHDELGNQVGCRRCGAYTKPIEFQVRGRVAVIEFNSDSTVHKTGFKLTYKGYLRIIPRVVHEQIVTDEALDDLSAMLDEIE